MNITKHFTIPIEISVAVALLYLVVNGVEEVESWICLIATVVIAAMFAVLGSRISMSRVTIFVVVGLHLALTVICMTYWLHREYIWALILSVCLVLSVLSSIALYRFSTGRDADGIFFTPGGDNTSEE